MRIRTRQDPRRYMGGATQPPRARGAVTLPDCLRLVEHRPAAEIHHRPSAAANETGVGMQWLLDNWLLVLLGGGMVVMHLFGHGGHGRHRGGKPPPGDSGAQGDASKTSESAATQDGGGQN